MLENLYSSTNYTLSKKLMDAAHIRHEALSNNIANAETKGYKRRDLPVTFQKELNNALDRGDKDKIKNMGIRTEMDSRTKPVRMDGNNVELDRELLEINRNTLNYFFLSDYIGGKIKTLNSAIKGQIS